MCLGGRCGFSRQKKFDLRAVLLLSYVSSASCAEPAGISTMYLFRPQAHDP